MQGLAPLHGEEEEEIAAPPSPTIVSANLNHRRRQQTHPFTPGNLFSLSAPSFHLFHLHAECEQFTFCSKQK